MLDRQRFSSRIPLHNCNVHRANSNEDTFFMRGHSQTALAFFQDHPSLKWSLRPISKQMRQKIVYLWFQGEPTDELAKRFLISERSVGRFIDQYMAFGHVDTDRTAAEGGLQRVQILELNTRRNSEQLTSNLSLSAKSLNCHRASMTFSAAVTPYFLRNLRWISTRWTIFSRAAHISRILIWSLTACAASERDDILTGCKLRQ